MKGKDENFEVRMSCVIGPIISKSEYKKKEKENRKFTKWYKKNIINKSIYSVGIKE